MFTFTFFLGFTDELEKQILNNWSEPMKNKSFNIYNGAFKKKKTLGDIIILHLSTNNLGDMIYSSWDIERDRLKLLILGQFLPFNPNKKPENQNLKKMKKLARNIIILLMCTKNHNHMMYSSWDTEWDRQKFL